VTPVADAATVVAEAPDMGVPLRLVIVAIAGGAGCAMRVLARDALERRGGQPWRSICAINLAGALAMGAVMALTEGAAPVLAPWAAAAAIGALAGWTTYSAFAMDVVQLWLRGHRGLAVGLCAATLAGAPLVAVVGHSLARALAEGGA
jgi:CrcB protein